MLLAEVNGGLVAWPRRLLSLHDADAHSASGVQTLVPLVAQYEAEQRQVQEP